MWISKYLHECIYTIFDNELAQFSDMLLFDYWCAILIMLWQNMEAPVSPVLIALQTRLQKYYKFKFK